MIKKRQEVLLEVNRKNGTKTQEFLTINLKDEEYQRIRLYRDLGSSGVEVLNIKDVDVYEESKEIVFHLKGECKDSFAEEFKKVMFKIVFKEDDITEQEFKELKEKIFEFTGAEVMVDYIFNIEHKKYPKKEAELATSVVHLNFDKVSGEEYEKFLSGLDQGDLKLLGDTGQHLEGKWESYYNLSGEAINHIEELFIQSDLNVDVRVTKAYR